MSWPPRISTAISGSNFYRQTVAMNWRQRDSLALQEFLAGNVPSFLREFVPIHTSIVDSSGQRIFATFFAARDYLSLGSDDDWARIPLTPITAQKIANRIGCFLPTRKMVDIIYHSADIQLEPVPMYAFRDSTPTLWHHHLIVEGQRKDRKGLIAGIKKDVVISDKISRDTRPNREAIYGWHQLDGSPIQPLYTGHANGYVDYSHGIRLIYRKIKVNNRWMDYKDILKTPHLRSLLCDEAYCDFTEYT